MVFDSKNLEVLTANQDEHTDPTMAIEIPPNTLLIIIQVNYFSQLHWGLIPSQSLPVNIFPVLSNLLHKGKTGLWLILDEYYSSIFHYVNLLACW